ncbi:MAG: peptidyl-prolyl cis-trans isomerase [Synergistaceae bacterium]|nr:peptidyl-prolyl cis-trans isomerase [Synergistaceae bacterium]
MKKSFSNLMLVCAFVLASAIIVAAAEQAAVLKDPDRVLARVEGQEIRERDIDQVIQMAGPQGAMYDNEQGRKAILDELVAARLFALSGVKQGLDKTPAVTEAIANFTGQVVARAAIEKIMQDIVVPDDEAKKFYDGNPDQFATPEEIRVRHILVSDDVTSADTIRQVQAALSGGTSFDRVAQERSICPSAPQGGDLGFFSRGQMVPEFEAVAFTLKNPGDVSDPVQTSFGWHIIRLEERRPESTLAYDDVKPQIIQYLASDRRMQRYQETLEALKKEYKTEILLPASGEAAVSPDKQ